MRSRLTTLRLILFAVALAIPATAASVTYTTDASFAAAAGGGLTSEGFETAVAGGTTVTFPGGTFTCSGVTYCPSFFGVSSLYHDTGFQSVFFSTPDTATFTFSAAITAFGIAIGGAGDVAPITLGAHLSNGDNVSALTNYTGAFAVFNTNRQYFGVISTVPFTSISFTGSNSGDGIFFDTMTYGTAASSGVPEPGSLGLLATGLAGLMFGARRMRSRSIR